MATTATTSWHHPAAAHARRSRAPATAPRGENRSMGGLNFSDAMSNGASSDFAREKQRGYRAPDESVQRAPPFGFTGYIADNETGLLHARARQYSPTLGRFVGRDPIGYWGDGYGLYCAYFVPNFLDPLGLTRYSDCVDNKKKEYEGPGRYKRDGCEWQGGMDRQSAILKAIEDCIHFSDDRELDTEVGNEEDSGNPNGPAHREKAKRDRKRQEDEAKENEKLEQLKRSLEIGAKVLPAPPTPSDDVNANRPQTTPPSSGDSWDALSLRQQLEDRLRDAIIPRTAPGAPLLGIDPNAIETVYKILPERNNRLDEAMHGTER